MCELMVDFRVVTGGTLILVRVGHRKAKHGFLFIHINVTVIIIKLSNDH